MNNKKINKKLLIFSACILLVYLLVRIVTGLVIGNDFSEVLELNYGDDEYKAQDLTVSVDNSSCIESAVLSDQNGKILISIKGAGEGEVLVDVSDADGNTIITELYKIYSNGGVRNENTGNFAHCRLYTLYLTIMIAAFSALLWWAFIYSRRTVMYSYHEVFCSGFSLWLLIEAVLLFYGLAANYDMMNIYILAVGSARHFMWITSPLIVIFAVSLTVSNISLIKNEGFNYRNVLGILISFVMVAGGVVLFLVNQIPLSGSERFVSVISMLVDILYSVYVICECFLFGAILSGLLAAVHKPKADKDFIVILGCKIKPDGTLYPLIKGRVDAAIKLYKKQLETNGKKAVFVPSGGKGRDECISEAQAMKNYLVSQGIGEEQIMMEDQSKNTLENMKFSKKLINERNPQAKSAFTTTNFHVFRSGIISRQVDFYPEGAASNTKWYFWPNAFIREVLGMASYMKKTIIICMVPIIAFLVVIHLTFNI